MPKTPKEIYNDELKILNEFISQNDPRGMYLYMEEKFPGIQYGTTEGAANIYDAWTDIIKEVATSRDETHHEFAREFFGFGGRRIGEMIIDAGRETDEIEQQIINGEIEETELISSDPKSAHKVALMINNQKSEIGRRQDNVWQFNQFTYSALNTSNRRNRDERREEYTKLRDLAGDQIVKSDGRVDEAAKKRYKDESAVQPATFITHETSQNERFHNHSYSISEPGSEKLFSEIPEQIEYIRQLNDEDLEQYRQELISNRNAVSAYYDAGREWAVMAGELMKEMEDKATPDEKAAESYQKLKEALELNAGFGKKQTYQMPGNKDKKKAFGFEQEAFQDFQDLLAAALEAYPDKDFGGKVFEAASQAGQKLGQIYETGVRKVMDEASSYGVASPKRIEKDIRLVEREQSLRILKADPKYQEVKSLQGSIKGCANLQSDIAVFKDSVRKSIHSCHVKLTELQDDAKDRQIADKDRAKHTEYFGVLDKFDSLGQMDMENMTPKQILDRMKEVKQEADHYESTHAGLRNFTKAWLSEGRNRVRLMQSISETLDKQIKALEPSVETMEGKLGEETLGGKYSKLQEQKTSLRSQAAAIRADVLEPPDVKIGKRIKKYQQENAEFERTRSEKKNGTIMESASYMASKSLQKLSKVIHLQEFTEQQKEQVVKHIGRIIAYDTRPFNENKDMSDKEYKKFVGDLGKNEQFSEALKRTMGDITPKNLEKFLTNPNSSKEFSMKFAEVRKEIFDVDAARPSKAPEIQQEVPESQPSLG